MDACQRSVFVVYGRDLKARNSVFTLLRAYDLNPLEWEKVIRLENNPCAFIGDIVSHALESVGGVVVILSGDETIFLKERLHQNDADKKPRLQPRANVLFEAGLALAFQEKRTLLVKIGDCDLPSDLAGRNYITLENNFSSRKNFGHRLRTMGYELNKSNMKWANIEINYEK